MNPGKSILKGLILAYRYGISPVLPPSCRYTPTCSQYALTAIDRFGALRGGWLAVRRILRCHPWGGCGHDPVPDTLPPAKQDPNRLDSERDARHCHDH